MYVFAVRFVMYDIIMTRLLYDVGREGYCSISAHAKSTAQRCPGHFEGQIFVCARVNQGMSGLHANLYKVAMK